MAPQNIQVNSLSASQLELTWDPPPADSQNGNIQGYKAMLLFLSWFHLSCLALLLLVRWLYNYSCPHCTRQITAVFGLQYGNGTVSQNQKKWDGGKREEREKHVAICRERRAWGERACRQGGSYAYAGNLSAPKSNQHRKAGGKECIGGS